MFIDYLYFRNILVETGKSLKFVTEIPEETTKEKYSSIGTYLEELDQMKESPKKELKGKNKLKAKDKFVVQKKMSSKERKGWTEEKEDFLSEVWELESVLYNRRNENYSDPVERKNAEERISQELDIDGMF